SNGICARLNWGSVLIWTDTLDHQIPAEHLRNHRPIGNADFLDRELLFCDFEFCRLEQLASHKGAVDVAVNVCPLGAPSPVGPRATVHEVKAEGAERVLRVKVNVKPTTGLQNAECLLGYTARLLRAHDHTVRINVVERRVRKWDLTAIALADVCLVA